MSEESRVELDFVLSILSQKRARFVCYYLMSDNISKVNELFLAREVGAWETGVELSQVSTENVLHLLEDLQDDLLPRLDEAGLVEYNPGNGVVRYGNPPEPFARLLTVCQSFEQPNPSP